MTREQSRAKIAFEQITSLPKEEHKKYGQFVLKLPALVRSAGLVGAVEFIAKNNETVLRHLDQHLKAAGVLTPTQHLRERSRSADLSDYMRLTREVQAALQWHKRYAQSVLGIEPGEDGP